MIVKIIPLSSPTIFQAPKLLSAGLILEHPVDSFPSLAPNVNPPPTFRVHPAPTWYSSRNYLVFRVLSEQIKQHVSGRVRIRLQVFWLLFVLVLTLSLDKRSCHVPRSTWQPDVKLVSYLEMSLYPTLLQLGSSSLVCRKVNPGQEAKKSFKAVESFDLWERWARVHYCNLLLCKTWAAWWDFWLLSGSESQPLLLGFDVDFYKGCWGSEVASLTNICSVWQAKVNGGGFRKFWLGQAQLGAKVSAEREREWGGRQGKQCWGKKQWSPLIFFNLLFS